MPWVFVLGYLVGVALQSLGTPTAPPGQHPQVRIAGVALLAVGALIAGWGLITFRRARTTTVPGERSARLVTWGPYRFTRNPMYVGLTLAYAGESAWLGQLWPLVLLPLVVAYVNRVVIPLEEATLRAVFGPAYEQYCTRVRRWM